MLSLSITSRHTSPAPSGATSDAMGASYPASPRSQADSQDAVCPAPPRPSAARPIARPDPVCAKPSRFNMQAPVGAPRGARPAWMAPLFPLERPAPPAGG